MNRLAKYLLGSVIIMIPFLFYQFHIQWLGFPDGHLTELDRWENNMFAGFSGISIVYGVFLLYSGWKPLAAKNRMILMLSAVYLLAFVVLVLLHYNIGSLFRDGSGG